MTDGLPTTETDGPDIDTAALRRRHEAGESLARLARQGGIGLSRLKAIAVREGWSTGVAPARRARRPRDTGGEALGDVIATVRLELTRLRREAATGAGKGETIARTLASLTRSLDKASALAARERPGAITDMAGVPPYDVDELRRSLADKLDRFRRARLERGVSAGA